MGSELATPSPEGAHYGTLKESHVLKLEEMIDLCETDLPPLVHFILPGGSPAAAALHLARGVWDDMAETDSRECRNCHGIDFMAEARQDAGARLMHELAEKWQMTCIDCHKGIAHRLPRDFDSQAAMDDLHARLEDEDIECRECHAGMAKPPAGEEW